MIKAILATKKEMSQAFVDGVRTPVTRVLAGPCVVTQVKNHDRDGYWAVQLGMGEKRIKNITKALQGHLKGALTATKRAPRFLKEIRTQSEPEVKVGDEIKVTDLFVVGDQVMVTGVSKGKGFAGGVKRWGFAGGPKTHGQSDRHRAPGSIGQGTTPGRVWKGKKMAGRMGTQTVTVRNLKVVAVGEEDNTLTLSGSIPGPNDGLLVIRKVGQK